MAYLLLICLLICRSGWNAALAIKHGGRNHGSPAVTKTAWTLLRNTSGICSANQPIEDTFCRPWRAVCCPTQVATLITSVSSTDGRCSGQTDATLAVPYRLRGDPHALLMNLLCGSGADYTTRTCCPFSGLLESLTLHKGTLPASCWTCIPWTETGKPSPTQRSIPTRICPGRTGRSWRTKASPPRRRRYRRRSAACVRSHPWHRSTMLRCLAAWNQCPLRGFGERYINSFCATVLPVTTRSLCQKLLSAFMWARSGFRSGCCTMANDGSDREAWSPDSDRIEREAAANGHPPWMMVAPVTPGGTPLPRGPPPPRPVQEQRDIALHMSRAVVQAFNERGVTIGTALTLLPEYWWNLQGVRIRIDPLTPGHSFHPNLLTVADDPPNPATAEDEDRAGGSAGADAHRE